MPSRDRPARVLVVSQYRDVAVGGAERYLHEVCTRLGRHDLDLDFLCADAPGGLSAPRWRLASAGFHPRWPREVGRWLRDRRPDVLYVHHSVPGLTDVALRAACGLRLPSTLMYHGDVTGPDLPRRALGALYQRLLGDASLAAATEVHVGTLGYAGRSAALRRLRCPLVEAPPGVDAEMAGGTWRPGPPFLLFVGKPDVPSKGFGVLLRAWRVLRREWPDLELVVAGAARSRGALPGVRWLGPVTDRRALADLYASALLTVLPSTSPAESFGMVLAEALVAGCPVVGSRVGGLPDLIEEGLTGYLARPGDPAGLLGALRAGVQENGRLRAEVRARRGAYRARFSWDHTAATVARSLLDLADRGPVPRAHPVREPGPLVPGTGGAS